MPKRVKPEDKIVQRSVGFTLKQINWMAEHPHFKPDKFCRKAIQEQIEMINGN